MSTRRPRRARHGVPAALVLLAAFLLSACTSLPTSGAVQASEVKVSAAPDIDVQAVGPVPGAGAGAIVESFLLAQTASDNFAVAREYLAGDARATWKPLAGVVIGSGDPKIGMPSDSEVSVDVSVVGHVDANGNYAEAAPGARETVTFGMVQDSSGEWRISSLPDGLILQGDDFQRQFRATQVYFLSADHTYLVPETRWFPAVNLPTSVMDALLAGPSDWLRDAVDTAVPDGLRLKPETVTIDNGQAQVSLGASPSGAKEDDDALLVAQVDASLAALPGVFSVRVTAGGVPLDGAATLSGGPAALGMSKPLVFLSRGRLEQFDGTTVSAVRGVASLDGLGASDPAVGADGTRVMLVHGTALATIPTTSATSQVLYTAPRLVAPSVDRFGWAWTSDDTGLVAARSGADPVHIRADWLAGRTVRSLAVAADGARVAIVSEGADGVQVDVAGVTRDDGSVPRQLGTGLRTGASLTDATQVTWIDEATLGVLGKAGGTSVFVNRVPVAGPTTQLPQVADVVRLAGGPMLVVATQDGALRRFVSATWVPVPGVTDASDPSYPG